ncbi:conjugal transfer protein TrbK [Mesorhizobium hungaricum]|jgi:conjugative transfer region protein TrbK|uniref:Conjugal transfer protein TrbK n=1 Tax=Mesorhizobium hungaricum TaxID=1566387 RepID=A0A1C2DNA3_9HYPH|nr:MULTISPECIES: putative entry exclusion protein TrbK-alt [Mesorhizobium]MBN9237032.1 putative entry exclusion protein TrbK-alt [Mesorhizobium sp.]OCX16153.1 conjugal transfer protein TrbK [Mesorhizobium hungaricum]
MDGKLFARIGAIVFVAVAVTATAIEMTRKEEEPASPFAGPAVVAAADPLRAELIRCQRLGEAGPRDPACLSAWAESRERFLARGARPGARATQATEVPPAPADAARESAIPDDPIRKEMAPRPDEAR